MSFSDNNKNSDVICSFCGKRGDQVKRMLAPSAENGATR